MDDTERLRMILELNKVIIEQHETRVRGPYNQTPDALLQAIDRLAAGIGMPQPAPPDPPPF